MDPIDINFHEFSTTLKQDVEKVDLNNKPFTFQCPFEIRFEEGHLLPSKDTVKLQLAFTFTDANYEPGTSLYPLLRDEVIIDLKAYRYNSPKNFRIMFDELSQTSVGQKTAIKTYLENDGLYDLIDNLDQVISSKLMPKRCFHC